MPVTAFSRFLLALSAVALLLGGTAETSAAVTSAALTSALGLPSAHLGDADAVTAGVPVVIPGGASYAFSSVVAGVPVRWNPCAPIHWKANVARGPVGGLDVVKAAVAGISGATGTQWVYDGTSAQVPATSSLPTVASTVRPILIGWTDGAASDLLRGKAANVLGMTRTVWFGRTSPTGTVAATRGAVIALDRTDRLPLRGNASWSSVMLHELGHAMGLDHAHNGTQLMNAVLPTNLSGLQAGDRAGLRLVGRAQGCINL
jgi:hypothetical protein